ncbi:DUF6025 family protein [Streptomyces sp. NPDC041068]|uniref:DUF6025 family protein n=1 Tax=Streptomyces sp. NPDC041068 TaxID=3155130 RepID=UPI003406B457
MRGNVLDRMSGNVLDRLGLAGSVTGTDALASGQKPYMTLHFGTLDIPVGDVLDLIRNTEGLVPPRTGHLGNWEDIALCRSGPMDFNTAICTNDYGYPLVYGFTRTEAESEGGDDVYLPGSLVEGGGRTALPLYTWNGRDFTRRDRSRPLFCALTQTEVDGELVPLAELHWERMKSHPALRFKQWASVVSDHADLVTDMLCLLIEEAGARQNPRAAFAELISHAVLLDGSVGRCEIRRDGDAYLLDGHRYPSARALAEAALLTVGALSEPRRFFSRMRDVPPVLPVISIQLSSVLFGLLGTHLPGSAGLPSEDPFLTHLHWGARAMAGCPPRRGGYLARKSTVRSLRAITGPLVRDFEQVNPLCFGLLPAQIFMLCPPDTEQRDEDLIADLFTAVLAAAPDAAHDTARGWLSTHQDRLSPYLRGRFEEGRGVPTGTALRGPAAPVEPAGFRKLTFRQACAVVGAFEEALA